MISLRAAENPFPSMPDALSVSHSTGPFSHIANPVFTDVHTASNFAYRYYTLEDRNDANHFFALNMAGFALSYLWYEHLYDSKLDRVVDSDTNYFNISRGLMTDHFGFGLGYSFSRSETEAHDEYRAWNIGFLLRPYQYISLGVDLSDMWARVDGKSIRRKETYSLALRPGTDRLSLCFDIERKRGQGFSDLGYYFSVEGRLKYDISLFLKSDIDGNFNFGVSVPLFLRSGSSTTVASDYYMSNNRGSQPSFYSFAISLPKEMYRDAISISSDNSYLYLRFDRAISERKRKYVFGDDTIAFYDIINAIKNASSDDTIDGIVMRIDDATPGFAQIQEIRSELKKLRKKGKVVYAILTTPGNREYYLASAADKIYYSPASTFYLEGLSASVYFFKGLFDQAGVKYESVRRGEYKSLNEPFTRTSMSNEYRENLVSLLGDLNDQFISDIMKDRNIPREYIDKLFAAGHIDPEKAKKMKFIDEINYPDSSLRDIGDISLVKLKDYIDEKRIDHSWTEAGRIAVVYMTGSIIRGKSSDGNFVKTTGSDSYYSLLAQAFADTSVQAVVIRVDSGGGSAVASEHMWNALVEMKKKYDKPVVFSFGNVAASGGYYIACTRDKIFADRGTITGSIGVIAGKITLKELYEKLGISKETVKFSEFADIFSESKDLSEKERKVIQSGIDYMYKRFTGRVIESRGFTRDEVKLKAEGRVFTGSQAKKENLVDETGGLSAAIGYAAGLAELDDYRVVSYPGSKNIFSSVIESSKSDLIVDFVMKMTEKASLLMYKDEHVLYITPWSVDIE